jgi:hypothetical protein
MPVVLLIVIFATAGAMHVLAAPQAGYQDQPNMDAALQSLRQAQASLENAGNDKGGHQIRAIDLIRQAMNEVQAGINYANQHRGETSPTGWGGRLSADDQRRFDSYYSRWLEYRRTNNREEVDSMEKRMRDVMSHYNIPADVPFDQIATGGRTSYGSPWRGRLSADDQRRFDSYYSRWLEYRRTNNREEVDSMEKRMRDVMSHYNIPLNTPYGQIASPQ